MDSFGRLRQFSLLAHFSDQNIERLLDCTSRKIYRQNNQVLQEGEQSNDLFFIDTGTLAVQRNTPYGNYSLARLGPGELFGEASFIDNSARSGAVISLEKSELFLVTSSSLDTIFSSDLKFKVAMYWTIWKSLSRKLRETNELLTQFFSSSKSSTADNQLKTTPEPDIKIGIEEKRRIFKEQKLSSMEINFLTTLSRERRIQPNSYLFREGDPADEMFVVLEGKVMICKHIPGAGEEALAFLERGEYFGEMALIDNKPRSADAKTHDSGALVLSISRNVLDSILNIHKVSSANLLNLLCSLVAKRLRELDDKLVSWHIFAAAAGQSVDHTGQL